MRKSPSKILWAVDAFCEDARLMKNVASVLKKWTEGSSTLIEPVYVLTPDQISLPLEIFASVKHENKAEAKKRLEKMLAKVALPQLLAPTLLISDDLSLRSALRALLDYARQSGADLIAVSSQSKKGVSRFLFGSFAETLVLQSDIPVLLVTPNTVSRAPLKQILFATDFSEASEQAFHQVLDLAERQKLQILLFNKVEYFTQATAGVVEGNAEYRKYLKTDLVRRNALLLTMASRAKARGIRTSLVLDSKPGSASISDSVLRACHKYRCQMVAVASQSGPVATMVLGSVARKILRGAVCPVWIIHPKAPNHSVVTPSARQKRVAQL